MLFGASGFGCGVMKASGLGNIVVVVGITSAVRFGLLGVKGFNAKTISTASENAQDSRTKITNDSKQEFLEEKIHVYGSATIVCKNLGYRAYVSW